MIAAPVSSFTQENGARFIPVNLKPFGDIFKLQTQNSGTYAGILSESRLVNTLNQFSLRLDATLLISEVRDIKGAVKSKSRAKTPAKIAREYTIRITIHGLRHDKEAIGNLLSDAGFFLQHPGDNEVLPGVEYDNPHYLLRPGAEMPRFKDLRLETDDDGSLRSEPEDEIRKSNLLRLFETAEADGGSVTVLNTLPSPRLHSPLMRYDIPFRSTFNDDSVTDALGSHQIVSLAFMLEKENGHVEQPMFPSLWKTQRDQNSQILR